VVGKNHTDVEIEVDADVMAECYGLRTQCQIHLNRAHVHVVEVVNSLVENLAVHPANQTLVEGGIQIDEEKTDFDVVDLEMAVENLV